jgi:DHA2 family multidrug resistance protein
MPITFVAFATLADSSRTEAGALLTLARNIGGSTGISVVVTLLSRSAQINQSYLAEHFTPYSIDRWNMIGATPGSNLATGSLIGEISRQALAIAYSNDFRLLAVAGVVCLPLGLLLRPPRRPSIAIPSRGPAPIADLSH